MQLHVRANFNYPISGGRLSLRCPACKQRGTFEMLASDFGFTETAPRAGANSPAPVIVGHRMCPNPTCSAHLFVVVRNQTLEASYPPERIDFETTSIPGPIVDSFEEAITCHANHCFVAAAIMVRKTLEMLCLAQDAKGPNLKERLKALGSKAVLPDDLLNGLNDIRLLGNDAAHVESQVYGKVSQQELDVAIELTKEVLKAIYQYTALLERMRSLKQKAT